MAKDDGMFLYIGTYASESDARADYDIVKDLHIVDVIGTFDAAVITKDDNGKVHVDKDEMATRHAGWGGAAVGAAVGISRSDVKELGELIDAGEAALLVIGATTLQEALDKAGLQPRQQVIKQLDTSTSDVDAAVAAAKDEVS